MRFRNYDGLRTFGIVARYESFAAAAGYLNLTKGAVSHQIRLLEQDLGFEVFNRHPRGILLNTKGRELLELTQSSFETIEQKIDVLRQGGSSSLTLGVSTYFASRWLSPKLMLFLKVHPDIRLKIQPMVDLADLRNEGVDLAIRWGNGHWKDGRIEKLFDCPAWPCGNEEAYLRVQRDGLENAFSNFTLLRDREDSDAWSHWYEVASMPFQAKSDTLIIPDPNVRVQAVMDGQGVALNDVLIDSEIDAGHLFRLSEAELADYGYFLVFPSSYPPSDEVKIFADWLKCQVKFFPTGSI